MRHDLGTFMAAIRYVESDSVEGDYQKRQPPVNGVRARGAYGFTNWKEQATAAGLPDANMVDPAAQDQVAAVLFRRLHQRYDNWDLVALAWYANEKIADSVAKAGYAKPNQFANRKVRGYIEAVRSAVTAAGKDDNVYEEPYGPGPTSTTQRDLSLGEAPRQPKASEMLAQFIIGLADKTAGGTRQDINDLAPLQLTPEQETEKARVTGEETTGSPTSSIERLTGGAS